VRLSPVRLSPVRLSRGRLSRGRLSRGRLSLVRPPLLAAVGLLVAVGVVAGCGDSTRSGARPVEGTSAAGPEAGTSTAAVTAGGATAAGTPAANTPAGVTPAANTPAGVTPTGKASRPPLAQRPGTGAPSCSRGQPARVVRAAGRSASVAVPAGYDGQHRWPVVIALHGYDQQAQAFDAATGLSRAGTALGALVVVPQGLGSPAGWNVPDSPALGPSDVTFVGGLLTALVHDDCADPARVVLAGLSDGADMAVTAACALGPARVRAVLLVSASTGPSPRCAPLGVLQVHGTADPVDAYTGRAADTRRGFGSVKAAGAEQALALWSRLAGCSAFTEERRRDLRILDGSGCRRAVRLIAVQGGGHTWPSGRNDPALGRTTLSLDSGALLRDALAR